MELGNHLPNGKIFVYSISITVTILSQDFVVIVVVFVCFCYLLKVRYFCYAGVLVVMGPAQSIHKYVVIINAVQAPVFKFACCQSNQKQLA